MVPPCRAGGRVCSFGFGIISNLTPTGTTGPRGAGAKPTCLGCRPGAGLGHGGLSCLWAARGLGVSPGTHPPRASWLGAGACSTRVCHRAVTLEGDARGGSRALTSRRSTSGSASPGQKSGAAACRHKLLRNAWLVSSCCRGAVGEKPALMSAPQPWRVRGGGFCCCPAESPPPDLSVSVPLLLHPTNTRSVSPGCVSSPRGWSFLLLPLLEFPLLPATGSGCLRSLGHRHPGTASRGRAAEGDPSPGAPPGCSSH